MGKHHRDATTLDLFETPAPSAAPGGLAGLNTQIAHTMSAIIRDAGRSRFEIAARMSDLLGEDVTKTMLDAYTAESREDQNIPAYRLLAFILATDSFDSLDRVVQRIGCRLLVGKDAKLAALVQMEARRKELDGRIKEMKRAIGGRS